MKLALSPFGGMDILIVEPGHVVRHPITGEELTVDDCTAVTLGRDIYVTEQAAARIREAARESGNGG